MKPEETQMDTLGATKQKISSLHSDSSRKIWKTLVKAKFDKHFMAGTDIIYEQIKSNSCCQAGGKPIDSFVTNLHILTKNCGFSELKVGVQK